MARATRVKARPKKERAPVAPLDYPSPDEINEPPKEFEKFWKLFYGTKGIGKTSTVANIPNSLTIMAETKRKNLRIRQLSVKVHTAREIMDGAPDLWKNMLATTPRWIDDPTIETLNYDSIDLIYTACKHSVCASNGVSSPGKAGKESSGVWIEVADEFSAYFNTLADTDMYVNFLSHIKEREIEALDGAVSKMNGPSCSPACLQYIKQCCDFVLFYGYYDNKRAVCVRDPSNEAWTAVGPENVFMQPDGKPINVFEMVDNPSKSYQCVLDAFYNKAWDIDTPLKQRTLTKGETATTRTKRRTVRK